ncbi:hypothetical protein GPA10_05005 [Streptomyces sp. p1417]|uniref:Uncharacterized protein n=2 Tax=Streptomyces typhae TaxID=2681492 RepID=A0A6L6WSJ7_9ACTN|nr:hypothetical protein [Streptomyces typhae]
MYHTVALAYGFEIPTSTDLDEIDRATAGQDHHPDGVGYIIVGDFEKTLLVTRYTRATENAVVRLAPEALAAPAELAGWEAALHTVAVRLGFTGHPAPAWLLIHNYR